MSLPTLSPSMVSAALARDPGVPRGLSWLVPSRPDSYVPHPAAVLFEPSRHAAYILLTGPADSEAPGLVSVIKHKVRDLVPSSRVVHLGEGEPDSDQAIRDRFSRLRYRREA